MKTLLSLLCLLLLATIASAQDNVNVKYYMAAGVTNESYETDRETYTLRINLVAAGKLPASGYSLYLRRSWTIGSNATPQPFGDYQGIGINADGTLATKYFDIVINRLSGQAAQYDDCERFTYRATWDPSGYVQPTQVATFFKRVNVGTTTGSAAKRVERTVVIYPPDFVKGQWNVQINTNNNIRDGKDYLVKWDNDTMQEGRMWSVPAANPPAPQSGMFSLSLNLPPEQTPSQAFKVWRRIQGGTWGLIASGTCPINQTVVINDYTADPAAEVSDPSAQVPTSAVTQSGSGASSGTTTSTSGTGLSSGTSGGSSGTGTGTGTSGGTGSGGSGTQGLTEAQVANAVRQGVNNAAADSEGATSPNVDASGLVKNIDKQSEVDAFNSAKAGLEQQRGAASNLVQSAGKITNVTMPTVGSSSLQLTFPFPLVGHITIDFSPYASIISGLRDFLLFMVRVAYIFINIRIVKGALS